jgi:hypothetical protein
MSRFFIPRSKSSKSPLSESLFSELRAAFCVLFHLLIVTAAVSALPVAVRPLAAQTPQEIQKVAEQAMQRLHLQTELPREAEKTRFSIKLPPEAIWLVIAVAIGVLLYSLRGMLPIWRLSSAAWPAEGDLAGNAIASTPAAVLSTADELASQGRFVEAIHVLLLQGLADIRQGQQFADSLTSREILRTAKLPDAGRTSLRDIINRVELTYFGEHPAALPDYVACRASFNTLAQALHGSMPA